MHTRRDVLARSAAVAAIMASAGLLPTAAQAAWSQAAFEAKSVADAVKALFEWDAGGTGQMYLRWNGGKLVELTMSVST